MERDPVSQAIAKFAHEIARRIPNGEGFIAIERWKDEEWIRGDATGLLTLGTAILLRAAAGESAYAPLENRMIGMMPRGSLIGVLPVADDREIARLRKKDGPWWLTCGVLIAALVVTAALACLGLYTIAMWIL